MANYQIILTPKMVNPGTEGSMDNTVVDGKSLQRTAYLDVYNGTSRKIVEIKDNDTFNDTIQTLTTYPYLTILAI